MTIEEIAAKLQHYEGRPIRLMEVCGSHTAAIARFGIRSMLSPDITLLSGPGCPVCVTTTAYIDKLIALAMTSKTAVVSFGDLLRVPGSRYSLGEMKGQGADVRMVYAPMEILRLAEAEPDVLFVFAAVGFETTAPVYTLLLEELIARKISNVQLLTALKTMPEVIAYLLESGAGLDGFLAPGHVCAITGSDYFVPLADKYQRPFVVSGFGAEELLIAIYRLVQMASLGKSGVENCYPAVVTQAGNTIAAEKLHRYFRKVPAAWRGFGIVADSGLVLRKEYQMFDAGSEFLYEDQKKNAACSCGEILRGQKQPMDCPLFGSVCNPQNPQGACMVSYEGSCLQAYLEGRT